MEDPSTPDGTDPAEPGTVEVAFRCDPSKKEATAMGMTAFFTQIIRARGIVKSMEELDDGRLVGFVAPPGTDLAQLARECTRAVQDAFREQGIRTAWSLCMLDDQGRIYGLEP